MYFVESGKCRDPCLAFPAQRHWTKPPCPHLQITTSINTTQVLPSVYHDYYPDYYDSIFSSFSLPGEVFALPFFIGAFLDCNSSSSHPGFASSSMSAKSNCSGCWSLACIPPRIVMAAFFISSRLTFTPISVLAQRIAKSSPCLQCFEGPPERRCPFARSLCEERLRICHSD